MTENCKLCGSHHFKRVIVTREFEIIECKSCKNAFTYPSPFVPDYKNMDFHSGENIEKAEKLTSIDDLHEDWQMLLKLQTKMIKDTFDPDANILEIGCGEGILLEEIKKAGFKNLHGIEPSVTGAARAKRKGLNVVNAYFNHNTISDPFDLIMMSHVFEHIDDPLPFLEGIKSVLNKGGSIMLTQTNYKALLPTFRKEKWYAWVPEQHFWHFTPVGLKGILKRFGLKPYALNYCTLVHPRSKLYRIARAIPFLQDQFIVLAKLQ